MRIASLHRYPVKGLSPERVSGFDLKRGAYVPGDRLYVIENGPSGFDPAAPRWQPKVKYLMLMRNETLARLRTRYLDETTTIVIEQDGREAIRADLSTVEGRAMVEAFLLQALPDELRGPPKVLSAPEGFRFTDSRRGYVSIINRASVGAIEGWLGRPVDPLRFRGNILVDGLEPWAEFDLVGRMLESRSGLELKVTDRIVRCPAVDVDPDSGERDMDIPAALRQRLGHADCGVYAEVVRSGALLDGDRLTPAASNPVLPFL